MEKQTNLIRIKRPLFISVVFIFLLGFATPVLADYLGPSRTVTETTSVCKVVLRECMYVAAKGDYRYHSVDSWSCSNESKPWLAYDNFMGDCESWNVGRNQWGKEEQVGTVTVTQPEATIAPDLQNCTLQNGWCMTSPQLVLTATEPLSGYQIIDIEGSRNSETFACNGQTCTIPLTEGVNDFTYWALSSWGDSSQMGTTSVKVDTVSPDISLQISGSLGTGGWYTSNVTLSASAADATSGLATLEASEDNVIWNAYTTPLTFTDGVYTPVFRAADNAGNISTTAVTVSVDTITPSLVLSINGTRGGNGWYHSNTKINAIASDVTSGVRSIQANVDGGVWMDTNELSFSDGIHAYKFKTIDNAGNETEVSEQTMMVDTIPPAIALTEELNLGESFEYSLEDDGSGLYTVRIVIEDENEKFKKVVWEESVAGNKFKDNFIWDGRFADDTSAPIGKYIIWIKVSDVAGNETIKYGIVKVNPLSYFQTIPVFVPHITQAETSDNEISDEGTQQIGQAFGGVVTSPTSATIQVLNVVGSISGTTNTSSSSILWGAMAVALIGSATAVALEEKKRREEEEAAQAAQVRAEVDAFNAAQEAKRIAMIEQLKIQNWLEGQASLNTKIDELIKQGASPDQITALKETAATQGLGVAIGDAENLNQSMQQAGLAAYYDAMRQGRVEAAQKAEAAEQQAGLAAYYQAVKEGNEVNPPIKQETWFENAWNWAFNNQTELSLGTGAVVGLAAVVAVVAGVITAPALLIVGGAILVTAAIVTAGTVVLNSHFGLDLGNNLGSNLIAGTVATIVTTGVGLLLANTVVPWVTTTIASKCVQYSTACTQMGTIIDTGEELLLSSQLAYYTWTGDQDKAAQIALQLQLEQMDGGVPGNAIADELGDQLVNLGDDAVELIATYGDDIVPLLATYGDDAVEIIGAYGDEGISLLALYGDDAAKLIKEYGTPAVKLLGIVDPASVNKLLTTLDDDVLGYAIEQGPEAVSALSGWSNKELMEFGPELALRAKKDAKVLEAIDNLISLGPIDPKHLTSEQQNLINTIAENSMQYADEGQIVLGKWVDYGNGFTSYARETGSVHYNPHPDMWKLLGELGDGRKDAAWLVNQRVIQTGIDKGLPFEYTLEGIPADNILKEQNAVQLIFSGATDSEIKQALRLDYLPVRMKELQELKNVGYDFVFDEIANTFILSLP